MTRCGSYVCADRSCELCRTREALAEMTADRDFYRRETSRLTVDLSRAVAYGAEMRGRVEALRTVIEGGASIAANVEERELGAKDLNSHGFRCALGQLYDWRDEDAKGALGK